MRFPKSKYGNKYGSKKVESNGRSFDSKLERAVFEELNLLEKAGNISELKCQVSVYLTEARILFKPDFSFIRDGELIFLEVKGFETPVWRIKRRLWEHYGEGPLEIYKGSARNFFLHETIKPKIK